MRGWSRLQVVPARLLGQPLLEASGTGKTVILQPDTSRTAGLRVAGYEGHLLHLVGDVEEGVHVA